MGALFPLQSGRTRTRRTGLKSKKLPLMRRAAGMPVGCRALFHVSDNTNKYELCYMVQAATGLADGAEERKERPAPAGRLTEIPAVK